MKNTFFYLQKNKFILCLIIIASLLTLLPFIFDGHDGCIADRCGFIIGSNYRDGVWFMAVAATAFKTWPFQMPIYAGEVLQGYHYIPNLIAYLLSFIGIPISFSFYQLFPILYMIGIVLLSIIFARTIQDKPSFVSLFLFFTLFGIPLTIVTSLYHKGYIDNGLLINTFQATRILESIHFALSFLILLYIFLLIQKPIKSWKTRITISALVFLCFGIKFYTATLLLLILGLHELFTLLQQKDVSTFLKNSFIFLVSAGLSILIFYNPLKASANGSIFIFAPFSTVHHLIETDTLFHMKQLVLARYFLYEQGMSPRLLLIELFSTLLYVVFYFGTRVIGFFYILKQLVTRKITQFELILTITILAALTASVLFIQKGDWYNPMQFAVAAAFLMNYFAAKALYDLLKYNKYLFWGSFFIIFLLTFPSNLVNLGYLRSPARYVIPQKEMEALRYLKEQPEGVILSPIVDPDMAYVSAFTGKPTYVNFINVLQNNGIDYEGRIKEIDTPGQMNVDYIYLPKSYESYEELLSNTVSSKQYKEIYANDEVIIFKKI